jgi:hypothetical protein
MGSSNDVLAAIAGCDCGFSLQGLFSSSSDSVEEKKLCQTPIYLVSLGIEGNMWCDLVWNFKRYFGRCAGTPTSLHSTATT